VNASLENMMMERLCAEQTFEGAISTLLHDVVALHGAEFGDVQLPLGNDLVIVAQVGLSAAFLQAFKRVSRDDGSACGRALRERKTVVIADVERDQDFEIFRGDARAAGYRGVQSSPLIAGNGELIGMISTMFVHAHEPTTIEMNTLHKYCGQAADYLQTRLQSASVGAKAIEMHSMLCTEFGLDGSADGRSNIPVRKAASPVEDPLTDV
jgi:GAF domain-containing protein